MTRMTIHKESFRAANRLCYRRAVTGMRPGMISVLIPVLVRQRLYALGLACSRILSDPPPTDAFH